MYQLSTKDGILGYVEAVEHCYKLPDGSIHFVRPPEDAKNATGVIYGGRIYNLQGHNDFDGAETAFVAGIDSGYVLSREERRSAASEAAQQDTDEQTVELAYRVALIELEVM